MPWFLLVKEETHVAVYTGVPDRCHRRTSFLDRAGRAKLGRPPRVAASRKHPARISGVCGFALHSERACNYRVDSGQVAEDAKPKGPAGFCKIGRAHV